MDGLESPPDVGMVDEMSSSKLESPGDPQQTRLSASYMNRDERFRLTKKRYDRHFAQVYFCRLMQLKEPTIKQAQKKWPGVQVGKILEVQEGVDIVVVGTLYKEMKLKPSILDEYKEEQGLQALRNFSNLCSDDDTLVLEDESARMALIGDQLPVGRMVTGVVLAVRGSQHSDGCFHVTDFCFPGFAPAPPLPRLGTDMYVAFASGLRVGSDANHPLALNLLVEYLSGCLGSEQDIKLCQSIVRLVLAGGTVSCPDVLAPGQQSALSQASTLRTLKDVDMCTMELASSLPTDIMPGAGDPSRFALPQPPLLKCLFPASQRFSTLELATNPHEFDVAGVRILGSSGQNIDDLARYSCCTDRLELLRSCLEWGHIAPTAPDTLTCVPTHDEDPFIVESTPHVFFVGNQPKFETTYVQGGDDSPGVRLICVPDFASTGQVVLLNLRTLKCHPIRFDTAGLDM